MDSIIAVEIRQSLEQEFQVFLTSQKIHSLTFTNLKEMTANNLAAEVGE
jgi:fatty acid synthase